jgi:hypothetical protein
MSDKSELKVLKVVLVAPDKPSQEVQADTVDFRESGELVLGREGKLVAVFAAGQWVSCTSLTHKPFWAEEGYGTVTVSTPLYPSG